MKVYEKVTKTVTNTLLVRRVCDLCGRESKGAGCDEWDAGSYEVNETEVLVKVRQKEGRSYPETGSGTEYEIDLCPTCFKEKLVPALIAMGANIKQEEWDW